MNVAVSPESRGQGVGKAMLSMMMAYTDLEAYTLEVRVSNKPAIALYKQLGFLVEGIRPQYYIDEAALIMWYKKTTP